MTWYINKDIDALFIHLRCAHLEVRIDLISLNDGVVALADVNSEDVCRAGIIKTKSAATTVIAGSSTIRLKRGLC